MGNKRVPLLHIAAKAGGLLFISIKKSGLFFSEIRQQLRLFRIWINMSLLRQKSYIVHHPK